MPAPMPVGALTMASLALTAIVIGNAYYQKKQFYSSVVYITKSNPSMAAIYLMAFTLVILLGKLLKKVFFGQLRAAEFEHLIERSFYAVTETCLAFTVFRDDFSPKFVALFTVLLFLKAFHWLSDSRVDYMERSPLITVLFHIRVTCLLLLLMLLDLLLVSHACQSTISRGPSVQLVFGFEYAILFTAAVNIAVKYVCHTIDLRSENPWENKAVYLLYTELVVGLVKVVLYVIFMAIMIKIHTFPLFIIRPMYLTARAFKKALNDVIQSRRAIQNLNTLYPEASAEELASADSVCIICREEMMTATKLPCGHLFHSSCLRSWFQRQQTCPTCRMDILRQPAPSAQPQAAPAQGQRAPPQPQQPPAPQQQNLQPPPVLPFPPGNPFAALGGGGPSPVGVMPLPFPIPPFAPNVLQQQLQGAAAGTTTMDSTATTSSTTAATSSAAQGTASASEGAAARPPSAAQFLPPFFPFIPFSIPPPNPPVNFSGMTLEELKELEGRERKNVEARIKALQNIHTLLDAATMQMNQYNSIIYSLGLQTSSVSVGTNTSEDTLIADPPSQKQGDSGVCQASTSNEPTDSRATHVQELESSDALETIEGAEANISSSNCDKDGPFPSIDPDDPQEIRRRRLEKFSKLDAESPL